METARNADVREKIADDYFSGMIPIALPAEYEFVRNNSFRDREFTLEGMVSTMRENVR